jgi:hypothetical protein
MTREPTIMKIPDHFFNYYEYLSGTFMPNAEHLSGKLVVRPGIRVKLMPISSWLRRT